ncbi:MAG: hypothetical protein HUJ99_03195 [Bacteroidaceae bacterium]|nr:hypothetical protein [Bacteroidaceae bacterium]
MANKPRIRKSILVPTLLFLYSTGCFLYFIPRNNGVSTKELWITVIANYVIIALVFFALRKKEKLQQEREDDLKP